MRFSHVATALLSTCIITHALTIPEKSNAEALSLRELDSESDPLLDTTPLEKRRGGGGGRGGGSGGTSSGGGGGTTSGGGGTSGGTRPPSGSTGGGSTGGGSVRSQPSYGGRYSGGAVSPYRAGAVAAGVVPFFLIGGALGFWVLASGASWGQGAYRYNYPAEITYYNETSMMNETIPGTCLCKKNFQCSCSGETPDGDYVKALVGDGSYSYQQSNLDTFQITNVNGSRTLAVNGTVDSDDASGDGNAASPGQLGLMSKAGTLGLIAVIGSAVFLF